MERKQGETLGKETRRNHGKGTIEKYITKVLNDYDRPMTFTDILRGIKTIEENGSEIYFSTSSLTTLLSRACREKKVYNFRLPGCGRLYCLPAWVSNSSNGIKPEYLQKAQQHYEFEADPI